MTTREHLAPGQVESLHEVPQVEKLDYKPHGLWYQLNGDWERWMESAQWQPQQYRFRYNVHLGDSGILCLDSLVALDRFTEEYTRPFPWHLTDDHRRRHGGINWLSVSQKYDGIEIPVYFWERRMEVMWFYPWDCASGCLWRPRNARLELIGEVTRQWNSRKETSDGKDLGRG